MTPLLSILMPALHGRAWQTAADVIEQQAAAFGRRVEFLVEADDGEVPSGMKRRRLVDRASGDYIAFVDDDDEQAGDYVERLVEACELGVDVVTFNLAFYRDGHKRETWRLGLHADDRKAGLMTANHLCAWRSEIARAVPWCPDLGYADDQLWYKPMLASGLAKTEHHIDRVLYRYMFSSTGTANQRAERVDESKRYVGDGLRCYMVESREIAIEIGVGGLRHGIHDRTGTPRCYTQSGWIFVPGSDAKPFYTVRIA